MASFNIKPIFTNILLTEMVQIFVEDDRQHLVLNYLTNEFMSLLETVTKEFFLVFSNQL